MTKKWKRKRQEEKRAAKNVAAATEKLAQSGDEFQAEDENLGGGGREVEALVEEPAASGSNELKKRKQGTRKKDRNPSQSDDEFRDETQVHLRRAKNESPYSSKEPNEPVIEGKVAPKEAPPETTAGHDKQLTSMKSQDTGKVQRGQYVSSRDQEPNAYRGRSRNAKENETKMGYVRGQDFSPKGERSASERRSTNAEHNVNKRERKGQFGNSKNSSTKTYSNQSRRNHTHFEEIIKQSSTEGATWPSVEETASGKFEVGDAEDLNPTVRRASTNQEEEMEEFEKFNKIWKTVAIKKTREINCDLFLMPEDVSIGHCVAADLVMGAGIALQFRRIFKNVDELRSQEQEPGGLAVLRSGQRFVYYLVTKCVSTRKPSAALHMWHSLHNLKRHIIENNVKKLALPKIGCGLDGMEWEYVSSMLEYIFQDVDVNLDICSIDVESNNSNQDSVVNIVHTSPQSTSKNENAEIYTEDMSRNDSQLQEHRHENANESSWDAWDDTSPSNSTKDEDTGNHSENVSPTSQSKTIEREENNGRDKNYSENVRGGGASRESQAPRRPKATENSDTSRKSRDSRGTKCQRTMDDYLVGKRYSSRQRNDADFDQFDKDKNYSENVRGGGVSRDSQDPRRPKATDNRWKRNDNDIDQFDKDKNYSENVRGGGVSRDSQDARRPKATDNRWKRNDNDFDQFDKLQSTKSDFNYVKVKEIQADLFEMSHEHALGHCVAEDMNMGSGIAVRFRQQFKKVDDLLDQRQRQGGLAFLNVDGRYVYYLVTKRMSSGKPTYETFWKSLQNMKKHVSENGVKKLALPRIGCGLDGLEWSRVKKMIEYVFKDVDVEITICNFQQDFDALPPPALHNKKCKVVNDPRVITELEGGSIIIYLGSEDGYVTDEMKSLDEKFNIETDYKRGDRKVGVTIRTDRKKYILYGFIVKKRKGDPLGYANFQKCLHSVRKANDKDLYNYVGMQAFKDESDDLIVSKLVNLMRNTLKYVEIYICWPPKLHELMPRSF